MSVPTRIVVLLTGEAPAPIKSTLGGFTEWFEAYLNVSGDVVVEALELTSHNEQDALHDLEPYDGVVMSGSASMVAEDAGWMRFAVRTVQSLLKREQPFLGVCFGHQILGLAVGADVGPNPRGREMGTVRVQRLEDDDPLFCQLPENLDANVSHADVIREDPHRALQIVAQSPHDPFHVVRAGPWAWGVQYHPEFSDHVTRAYLEHRRETLDNERGAGTTEARLHSVQPTPDGHRTLKAFVELIQSRRRP